MRLKIPIVLLLVMAMVVCSSFASQRYTQYSDGYEAAVLTLADAVKMKVVDPKDAVEIRAYLYGVVRPEIDRYKEALARGEDRAPLDTMLDAVNNGLITFGQRMAEAKAKKAGAAPIPQVARPQPTIGAQREDPNKGLLWAGIAPEAIILVITR